MCFPISGRSAESDQQSVQGEVSRLWNGFKVSVKDNALPIFFVLMAIVGAAVVFSAVHFSGPKTGGMEM